MPRSLPPPRHAPTPDAEGLLAALDALVDRRPRSADAWGLLLSDLRHLVVHTEYLWEKALDAAREDLRGPAHRPPRDAGGRGLGEVARQTGITRSSIQGYLTRRPFQRAEARREAHTVCPTYPKRG